MGWTLDLGERADVKPGVGTDGYAAMVRSTRDGRVRVMVVPPDTSPTWVLLSRRQAFRWGLEVVWAALSGAWRERPVAR